MSASPEIPLAFDGTDIISKYASPKSLPDFARDRREFFLYGSEMARNRNDPDPFEDRRRKLAEQERMLAEQRRKLHSELTQSGDATAKPKSADHPVWRMEDEPAPVRSTEPTPARRRNLARQRQNDMIKLMAFIIVLLVVVVIALLVVHFHTVPPSNGT